MWIFATVKAWNIIIFKLSKNSTHIYYSLCCANNWIMLIITALCEAQSLWWQTGSRTWCIYWAAWYIIAELSMVGTEWQWWKRSGGRRKKGGGHFWEDVLTLHIGFLFSFGQLKKAITPHLWEIYSLFPTFSTRIKTSSFPIQLLTCLSMRQILSSPVRALSETRTICEHHNSVNSSNVLNKCSDIFPVIFDYFQTIWQLWEI